MPTTDELAAELEAVKASTPTLEELPFSFLVPCWNNGIDKLTSANAMTFLVAPIPLRVLSIALSFEYMNLPASDTAYWTLTAKKGSNPGGWTDVAARSTQNTGALANGGIVSRSKWTFDAAAWGNADLAAGDLLRVDFVPSGSVASLDLPFTVTIRTRPL